MTFNLVNYREIVDFIKNYSRLNDNTEYSTIMAVTKNQPEKIVLEAINAGITIFGENRVQEALLKYKKIRKTHKNIELHLIGALQTNKVKKALEVFHCIQTLDRESLAKEIVKNINLPTFLTKCFFVQVNTGGEKQKSGVNINEADAFIKYCRWDLKLNIAGLMCIPPISTDPIPHFIILKKLALKNDLQHLSMGMSNDYKIAIKSGSTFVRVGSLLFGSREDIK